MHGLTALEIVILVIILPLLNISNNLHQVYTNYRRSIYLWSLMQVILGHNNTTLRIYAKVKDKEAKMEISDPMNGIISLKDYSTDQ